MVLLRWREIEDKTFFFLYLEEVDEQKIMRGEQVGVLIGDGKSIQLVWNRS